MKYTISNEQYTAVIDSLGAELISLKHNESGAEIMWQGNVEGAWSKHSPLLFPFCGRLKDKKYTYGGISYDMGAHGFISKKEFSLLSQESATIELGCSADESTLDEAPMAYKPMEEIINLITPTAKILQIIKPVYNFKAAE